MIFDRVVGAAYDHFRNFSPLVVDDTVHEEYDPLFLLVPFILFDARVEVIVPALAALLSSTAVQLLRDTIPVFRPMGHNLL